MKDILNNEILAGDYVSLYAKGINICGFVTRIDKKKQSTGLSEEISLVHVRPKYARSYRKGKSAYTETRQFSGVKTLSRYACPVALKFNRVTLGYYAEHIRKDRILKLTAEDLDNALQHSLEDAGGYAHMPTRLRTYYRARIIELMKELQIAFDKDRDGAKLPKIENGLEAIAYFRTETLPGNGDTYYNRTVSVTDWLIKEGDKTTEVIGEIKPYT